MFKVKVLLSHVWLFVILCPWNSLGKNNEVGCNFLLQGTFLTQGSNPGLPHCRRILYRLSHQKRPTPCTSEVRLLQLMNRYWSSMVSNWIKPTVHLRAHSWYCAFCAFCQTDNITCPAWPCHQESLHHSENPLCSPPYSNPWQPLSFLQCL